MKSCVDCRYADWKRTQAGKLHPSGDGNCSYPMKNPKLPASMYWITMGTIIGGGFINRRETLKEDCVYFTRKS